MSAFLRRLSVVLATAALAGCVTPGRVSEASDDDLMARFVAGKASLECGLACVPVYAFNQRRILELQGAKDWQGLALAVMRADLRQDMGYFQLGLAAEGLKQWAAADRYYRMAGALATGPTPTDKCLSSRNLCAGFKLPQDIVPRLRAVAQMTGKPGADLSLAGTPAAAPDAGAAAPGDFIADAPHALLAQYAARRLLNPSAAMAARDALFREQLLDVFDPAQAAQTRGNEVTRPRAVAALLQRLDNQMAENRLTLGMYVQLGNYDLRSESFELRYPLYPRGTTPIMERGIYRGFGRRALTPWRDYSASGSTCVWEPPANARPGDVDGGFLMLTICQPHPVSRQHAPKVDADRSEVPPYFFLDVPRGTLWPRLAVDESRAGELVKKLGPSRLAWAELVFDVRTLTPLFAGPYNDRTLFSDKRAPALSIGIMPRALVVWEPAPRGTRPGPLINSAGELQPVAIPASGRLPRALVADRVYPSARPAAPARPAAAAAAAPGRSSPAAPPARPAKSKTEKEAVDDEAWIEPPPAKR